VTPVVLLLLVVLWVAVLAPGFVKRRRERRSTTSIESFHHQLHLLERTGPKIVSPAFRLETAGASAGTMAAHPTNSRVPAITSRPGRPKLVLVGRGDADDTSAEVASGGDFFDDQGVEQPADLSEWSRQLSTSSSRPMTGAYQRRQTLKRRRDVFLGLVGTFLLTAVLGFMPSLHALWALTAISGLALVGFVVLMQQARRAAVERRDAQLSRSAMMRRPSRVEGDTAVLARYREHANMPQSNPYGAPRWAAAGR
jgi:hypothetical protein